MATRKYLTEFGLNMVGGRMSVLQQHELKNPHLADFFDADHPCHIYLIARRPRIIIDPRTVKIQRDRVTGTFRIQRQSTFEDVPFDVPNRLRTFDACFFSPYPHTEYQIIANSGSEVARGSCALLMTTFGGAYSSYLDLDVLYVGQSYGENGERTAVDRLQSHSTLQAIYAEAIRRSPDMDIWLVLLNFQDPFLLMSFDGASKVYGTTEAEDDLHTEDVLSKGVSEQQRINYAEAALIRYFQPPYNTIFKDSFPSPAHKTYAECYDLDLNSVMVELQTETLNCRLFSDHREPDWVHIAQFQLHNREERMGMFDIPAAQRRHQRVHLTPPDQSNPSRSPRPPPPTPPAPAPEKPPPAPGNRNFSRNHTG